MRKFNSFKDFIRRHWLEILLILIIFVSGFFITGKARHVETFPGIPRGVNYEVKR